MKPVRARPVWAWALLAVAALIVIGVRLRFVASPLDRYEGACAWTVGLSAPAFRMAVLTTVLTAMGAVFLVGRRPAAASLGAAALGLASLGVGMRGSHAIAESVGVGTWIREHAAAGDAVAVLGSEPEIYVYAGRRAATTRLFMYGLVDGTPRARAKREAMFAEIEAARPAFVVSVNAAPSWRLPDGAVNPVLAWAESYIAIDYEQVGLIEIGEGASKPVWGEDAAGTIPGAASYLVVYRRKPEA